MRIGIDARFYGPSGKGLGRYTKEVVDNIIKINENDKDNLFDYVVFLSPDNFDEFEISSPRVEKILVNCPWYTLREQFQMPAYINKAKLDLIHYPHFNVPLFSPVKFVVTIHDLILTHFPTMRATTKGRLIYWLKNLAYRLVIFSALRRAKKIITVSEFTKQDIVNNFKVAADKIIVTYEGAADLNNGGDVKFCAKLDNKDLAKNNLEIPGDFLLYVGSAYPHKNLERLLFTFLSLNKKNYPLQLLLAGRSDYFYERLKKKANELNLWKEGDMSSRVIFAGYVPDENLNILYSKAKAYIFPSLYEGFGLPPLEAMSRSCPVLSSDRSSLPEILGEAALYFNPEDEKDIEEKIKNICENENLRQSFIDLGLKRAKVYDWSKCALETRNIYLAALK